MDEPVGGDSSVVMLMHRNRIGVLALDFDGTLKAKDRPVSDGVTRELRSLGSSGIRLVLVTGRCEREMRELVDASLFDAVVLENGAILLHREKKIVLVPDHWSEVRKGLLGFFKPGCEEVIIALDREFEDEARRAVDPSRARIEPNKNRLMIMPLGIDKTSGLLEALRLLGASRNEVMCVGDGENDLAMFKVARVRVALQNSVDALKHEADYVATRGDGEGVLEAIDRFIYGKSGG